MIKQQSTNKLLTFPIILKATQGEIEAINTVLQHYAGYIASMATRKVYDEQGNYYTYIDEWFRRRLETKLIHAIVTNFKVA